MNEFLAVRPIWLSAEEVDALLWCARKCAGAPKDVWVVLPQVKEKLTGWLEARKEENSTTWVAC